VLNPVPEARTQNHILNALALVMRADDVIILVHALRALEDYDFHSSRYSVTLFLGVKLIAREIDNEIRRTGIVTSEWRWHKMTGRTAIVSFDHISSPAPSSVSPICSENIDVYSRMDTMQIHYDETAFEVTAALLTI
jgi:hypothetical protein